MFLIYRVSEDSGTTNPYLMYSLVIETLEAFFGKPWVQFSKPSPSELISAGPHPQLISPRWVSIHEFPNFCFLLVFHGNIHYISMEFQQKCTLLGIIVKFI